MNRADDIRCNELAAMSAAGDALLRSTAVRELRAIMTRLAKGEVAMYLELWRTNQKAFP